MDEIEEPPRLDVALLRTDEALESSDERDPVPTAD